MYNLLKYSKNYSKTSGSLWDYYRDEPNSGAVRNINYSIQNSKFFDCKTSITGKLEDTNVENENIEIFVPLKYLINFWRTLDIPLISCEVSLILTWSANCVLTSKAYREEDAGVNPVAGINNSTNVTFKIIDTKLYVPVITLSTENDNKLLEQLKTRFKRTIKWNKYRSEMSKQTKNNNSNYLIDPTFTRVNRLFVLSFKTEDDKISFSKYYVPSIEIKDFNILIMARDFLTHLQKIKKKAMKKLLK